MRLRIASVRLLAILAAVSVSCGGRLAPRPADVDEGAGRGGAMAGANENGGAAGDGAGTAGAGESAGGTGSSSLEDLATYTSGTRLRARVLRAEGGVNLFQIWFDTTLGVDCSFRTAADGELRCLPSINGFTTLALGPDCSREAYLFPPGQHPFFLREREPPVEPCSAPLGPTVYELDEASALDDEALNLAAEGCSSRLPCVEGFRAFDPTAAGEVPSDAFVRGELVVEPRTGRVGAQFVLAEDGARELVGAYHRERSTPCLGPEWGLERCLPGIDVAYSEVVAWRGDSACTRPVAHQAECVPPHIVLQVQSHFGACGDDVRLYEVGAEVPADSVYALRDTCEPVDANRGTFFELGPSIPESSFAALEQRLVGGGDVRLRFRVAPPSVAPVAPAELADAEGRRVTVLRLTDTKLHGVSAAPTDVAGSSIFADEACVSKAIVAYPDPCNGALPALVAREVDDCSGISTLRDVEAIAGGYEVEDEGCVPAVLGDEALVLRVGKMLAPDTYPLLEEVVE